MFPCLCSSGEGCRERDGFDVLYWSFFIFFSLELRTVRSWNARCALRKKFWEWSALILPSFWFVSFCLFVCFVRSFVLWFVFFCFVFVFLPLVYKKTSWESMHFLFAGDSSNDLNTQIRKTNKRPGIICRKIIRYCLEKNAYPCKLE